MKINLMGGWNTGEAEMVVGRGRSAADLKPGRDETNSYGNDAAALHQVCHRFLPAGTVDRLMRLLLIDMNTEELRRGFRRGGTPGLSEAIEVVIIALSQRAGETE